MVSDQDSSDDPITFSYTNFGASGKTDGTGGISLTYLTSNYSPASMHITLTTPNCYFDIPDLSHKK